MRNFLPFLSIYIRALGVENLAAAAAALYCNDDDSDDDDDVDDNNGLSDASAV